MLSTIKRVYVMWAISVLLLSSSGGAFAQVTRRGDGHPFAHRLSL